MAREAAIHCDRTTDSAKRREFSTAMPAARASAMTAWPSASQKPPGLPARQRRP